MQKFFRTRLGAFVLFLVFVVVSQVGEWALGELGLKSGLLDPNDRTWRPSLFVIFESMTVLACLAGTAAVMWLGGRRLRELGYARDRAGRYLVAGSVVGLAAPALLIAGIAAFGGFTFGTVAMHGTQLAAYFLAWLAAMFGIGFAEEMTFRGPALLVLGDAIGFWPSALVTTFIFAGLHYWGKGPTETLADGLSVGLLGLFMCFTVRRTGSIWWAVGFHALFDYVALYVLGAPNSGNGGHPIPTRLLTGGYHGPAWLTGGVLGIEASWLVFPVIALLFAGFHFATRKRAVPAGQVYST